MALCDSTGYEEISLSSLSTSDHPKVEELLSDMLEFTEERKISLALPSLRVDNFSEELMDKINRVRKTGLTFAVEAGTQRLRDVINKNVTEEEVMETCRIAFEGGYTSVKLYFMIGHPTETMEDVLAINDIAQKIVDLYYNTPNRKKGRSVSVSVSVATFVPKSFTPFQWHPQDDYKAINAKHKALRDAVQSNKISYSWSKVEVSTLEAIISRGDRRLGRAIKRAWELGCTFDSWDECFDFTKWRQALDDVGLTIEEYANRERGKDEILPWDVIDVGVSKAFLRREFETATLSKTSPNCYEQCLGCGANMLLNDKRCEVCKIQKQS